MQSTRTIQPVCPYNSYLQKGGALLEDMRLLVRAWDSVSDKEAHDRGMLQNILAKQTRIRIYDTYRCAFAPRFLKGNPQNAWRLVRPLEDRKLPIDIVRPLYYWITARGDRLLHEFVVEELAVRHQVGDVITTDAVYSWIDRKLAAYERRWSESVLRKVARGLLATLRDFRILEGSSKKRVAPVYLSTPSFAYLAFCLFLEGQSGQQLVRHSDWTLFLLKTDAIERHFMDAHQSHFLEYQVAGSLVRISFPTDRIEEYADVIAQRTH
jgi:hypothetical protein